MDYTVTVISLTITETCMIDSKLKNLSLMDVMDMGVPRTYVVFCESLSPRWFNKWMQKDMQHCYVLHYDGYQWLKIERLYSGLHVTKLWHLSGFVFDQACNVSRYFAGLKNHRVLEVNREYQMDKMEVADTMRAKCPFELNNCVQAVCDFCGITEYFVWTPRRLYTLIKAKYLIREL